MISFKSVLLTSCLDWFGFSARLNPGLLFGDQSPSKDLSYFWWWARSPVGLIKSSSLHPAVSYSATVLYWLLHLLRNTAAAFWLSPAFKKSRRCAEYLHCTFAIRLQGRIGLIQHEQQHIATMTKHSYSDHILSNWSYHIISYHIISYHWSAHEAIEHPPLFFKPASNWAQGLGRTVLTNHHKPFFLANLDLPRFC